MEEEFLTRLINEDDDLEDTNSWGDTDDDAADDTDDDADDDKDADADADDDVIVEEEE